MTAADQVHRQAARLELAALVELERLIAEAGPWVRVRTACEVEVAGRRFPVPVVTMIVGAVQTRYGSTTMLLAEAGITQAKVRRVFPFRLCVERLR